MTSKLYFYATIGGSPQCPGGEVAAVHAGKAREAPTGAPSPQAHILKSTATPKFSSTLKLHKPHQIANRTKWQQAPNRKSICRFLGPSPRKDAPARAARPGRTVVFCARSDGLGLGQMSQGTDFSEFVAVETVSTA